MADGSTAGLDRKKLRLSPRARRSFAVVVPAYDEVENVPALVRELRSTFERFELAGEVLLVDDGSRDGTADAALRAAAGWSRLRVLRHPRNFGKTEALITAAQATDAEWLVVLDADLQYSPDEIPRFLAKLDDGFDIVTGRKIGRYEKRFVSHLYNGLSRAIFQVPVSDLNSMKAFRREILDEVTLRHDWHRFLVVLAWTRGHSVTEIDVTLHPRRWGQSKYSGPWRVVLGLFDLVAVGRSVFFSDAPAAPRGSTPSCQPPAAASLEAKEANESGITPGVVRPSSRRRFGLAVEESRARRSSFRSRPRSSTGA
jgi:glycosyltransferase involved in cell wall biosynthesis